MVGEHSAGVEVRPQGLVERAEETLPAQVAIKRVRTALAESLRFPEEGQSAQGQSAPKVRLKSVADGKQVNIPVPLWSRSHEGVTQKDSPACDWKSRFKRVGGSGRQIRRSIQTPRRDVKAFGPQSG